MAAYRVRRRQAAIEHLGGACMVCGSVTDLEIDHIDPSIKVFTVSGYTGPKVKFWAEVAKCQLLCGPHHREKTSRERQQKITREPAHGTVNRRRSGCHCDECETVYKAARRRWNMNYRGRP